VEVVFLPWRLQSQNAFAKGVLTLGMQHVSRKIASTVFTVLMTFRQWHQAYLFKAEQGCSPLSRDQCRSCELGTSVFFARLDFPTGSPLLE
jgi:hypothetical protein